MTKLKANAGVTARTVGLVLGQPVTDDNLFGRERELAELAELLRSDHVLLVAPRRVGKTSVMLRLTQQPPQDFDAIYLDVEGLSRPEDFVVALANKLKENEAFHQFLCKWPDLDSLLHRVKVSIDTPLGKAGAAEANWRDIGREIFIRLQQRARKLLIVIDELPYFVRRMATSANAENPGQSTGPIAAETFLSWFRRLRLDPALLGKVRFLVGGSIGLAGVLSRLRLSASVNDIHPYRIGPFDRPTAENFIIAIGQSEDIPLTVAERLALLDGLHHLVPFHIQLLLAELKHLAHRPANKGDRVQAAFESLLSVQGGHQLQHMHERLTDAFPDAVELSLARLLLAHASQSQAGIGDAQINLLADQMAATLQAERREQVLRDVLDTLNHDGYLEHQAGPDDAPGSYSFRSELLRRWWKRRFPRRTS
jgi:hypothetical protein